MIEKIKESFISQFNSCGFKHLPRVSMLSEAFPTNFTPSGGEEHLAKILAKENPKESFCVIQPCFRYQDIANIPTGFHSPLFEMGVAISVNELSVKEMIKKFFVLFDSFGLDRKKLTISVLDNCKILNQKINRDEETIAIWKEFRIKDFQFEYLGIEENFFMLPQQGYAGIKTEAFYNHNGKKIEIGVFIYLSNNVIIRDYDKYYLSDFKQNVICFGIGIERWAMILENKNSIIYLNENAPFIDYYSKIKEVTGISFSDYENLVFITKGLLLLFGDGARDDKENKGRANLLRKILRRLIENYKGIKFEDIKNISSSIVKLNAKILSSKYPKSITNLNTDFTIQQIQSVQDE